MEQLDKSLPDGMEYRFCKGIPECRTIENKFEIQGVGAVFDKWTDDAGWFKEKVNKSAFNKTIGDGADVRSFFNHDPAYILGRTKNSTLELSVTDAGLEYRVKLPDTTYARDLYESIQRGDVSGSSFMFEVIQDNINWDEETRELMEVRLFEVGPVTFPAYPTTSVSARNIFRGLGGDYKEFAKVAEKIVHKRELNDEEKEIATKYGDIFVQQFGARNIPALENNNKPQIVIPQTRDAKSILLELEALTINLSGGK